MSTLTEIADWWDSQRRESEEALQNWVNASDSEYGMYGRAVIAAGTSTAMVLGAGLVDVLRIGTGVQEGGWGYARDGMRLLTVAGPLLRMARLGAARFTYNPSGGLCASVATSKAIRHTGNRFFVSAKAIFTQTGSRAPRNLNEFLPALRSLGARVQEINPGTLSSLYGVVRGNTRSVVMFAVRWNMPGRGPVGHALYMFRNSFGRIKIADRSGRIVASFAQLEEYYPGISNASLQGSSILIHNAIVVEGTSLASMLALEVNAVLVKHGDGNREFQVSPVN